MIVNHDNNKTIAFYLYSLTNKGGGAERMLCFLANALSERGFNIHVITWDEQDKSSYYPLNNRITWHRLSFKSGIIDKFRRTLTLKSLLQKNKIKLLVGFVMGGDKTIYIAAKLARIKLIAAERNAPVMYHLRYKWYQRWHNFSLLHLCDRVIVQFPEYINGYPRSLKKHIESIANAVNQPEECAQPNIPNSNGEFVLLAVGRLEIFQKQYDCLIHAFARISAKHPLWILKIFGDGPDKTNLLGLISEYGLENRIMILESTADIFPKYVKANLFVIPSLWEGFPNSLSEAMSHGLPAVGFSQAEGVNHLIHDGKSGWLANGLDNPDELAEVLSSAMDDPSARIKRGEQARKQMEKYQPEKIFDQWARLVNELINK